MISMTEQALREIKRIMTDKAITPDTGFRVGVAGGGCSGFTYKVDFDKNIEAKDKVFEIGGVKLVCDMKSYLYLNGLQIDFEESLTHRGFTFKNPNASKTCGCGTSFSV